jgi:hypothetical protein
MQPASTGWASSATRTDAVRHHSSTRTKRTYSALPERVEHALAPRTHGRVDVQEPFQEHEVRDRQMPRGERRSQRRRALEPISLPSIAGAHLSQQPPTHPGYSSTSRSSRCRRSGPVSSSRCALSYGRRRNSSRCSTIPRLHMSALLSAGRRVPTDSGAAYSSVPVFPVRPTLASMSRDVPKSQSIARGLGRGQRMHAKVGRRAAGAYISRPVSAVSRMLPGLRSRWRIDLSC